MKKSRIIALLTAVAMIMSAVPALASVSASAGGYFVDEEAIVYEKSGLNLVSNPGFEDGLTGLTQNEEYYEVSSAEAHSGANSLKAIKSTKGEGAITAYFAVDDPSASYYLSFWYKNTDSTAARRPRVTFAFTDSSKIIPTEEDDFTEETYAWVGAGTASNDQDMAYSKGDWVQYSTVLKGNGNANACAFAVLNIYGLTKDVSFVDDFEIYELIPSEEYGDMFGDAVANWENIIMPSGGLEGFGTLELPRETGVEGVSVEWSSNTELINAETGEYTSGAEETLAILTARLYVDGYYDSIYYEYEYPYIIKSMFVPYIDWINNEVFAAMGSAIRGNVELPTEKNDIEGYPAATISWECSDPAVLTPEGVFTEPEVTHSVDLVATITCGPSSTTVTKRFKAIGGNIVGDGLVMYYDFESEIERGVVLDNSRNGATYNAEAEGVTVVDGYARFSGGSSAITLPTNYASELTGSYSVSMWVNLDQSVAMSGYKYRFFDFGGSSGSSQFLRYIPGTGQMSFMDRGTSGGAESWALDTTVTDMAQTWKLLTFTYDYDSQHSTATVYLDGQEIASSGANNTLNRSINSIAGVSSSAGFIGRTQWWNSTYASENPDFVGLMDDVRIYNRVITTDEIATLYAETRPTVTAPVTIKFQDIEGNVLKDDVTIAADVKSKYYVPSSYKTLPKTTVGDKRYVYTYMKTQSTDSVYVKETGENVCILIFKLEEQSRGANIITNPSFEDGLTGWTTSNYSTQMVSGQDGISIVSDATAGTKALLLSSAQGSSSAGAMSTRWEVLPDTAYEFSFDIKHNRGADVTTGFLELMDANGARINTIAGDNPGQVWSGDGQFVPTNSDGSWASVKYTFTTTSETAMVGLKLAWYSAAAPVTVDNFKLKEAGYPDPEDDDEVKIPVTIKYIDIEGNTIHDDVTAMVPRSVNTYTVTNEYKNIDDLVSGGIAYKYTYNAAETAKFDKDGGDVVSISKLQKNVATLVYDVTKASATNLVTDGSFKDANGNFSWGTWQSPQTKEYFKDNCQDWFYQVDRASGQSALYLTGLAADDYALGTRWNDGTEGLCSMANFIAVEAGKTYLVSYDYKHSDPAAAQYSYISTSFQKERDFAAGATGYNTPKSMTSSWQTNMFEITAPEDGYIYFHFSYLGESNNQGNGPFWYFDNFEVRELITFENEITYSEGYAEILAEDGTTGYLVQAMYDAEGALTSVVISEKLTLNKETATKVPVQEGAKLMLVKDLTSLEPLAAAIIAE